MGFYELKGDQFEEVVATCRKLYQQQGHRAVVLVTVRDPVQRTVSWIHQQCNKNYGRMGEFQRVCERCEYCEDKEEWDRFVDDQIEYYMKLAYRLPYPIYTMEDVMIDRFLAMLGQRSALHFNRGSHNLEKKQICDFHVPSSLFKRFHEARMVYRELVTGVEIVSVNAHVNASSSTTTQQ